MQNLRRDVLASGKLNVAHTPGAPVYPINILQFGEGNFLRAFVDWQIDNANGQGLFKGGVAIAQPLPKGMAEPINAQEGLYTVLLRGIEGGQEVEQRRVVSCVQKALNPYEQWDAMLSLVSDPGLRFVISNTTEAGIADADEAYTPGKCPDNFPAKVAALLYARYQKLGGTKATGLVFIPCELIEANGTNLKRIVLLHAKRWKLEPAFSAWVEKDNYFLDTLVDRIVPGYPANEAAALCKSWGYQDNLIVAAEPFHVWVIQGPKELGEEFPLHKAGLNVIWTDDQQPYRTRKVRILNGAHTASSLAAYRSGLDTVKSMIDDPIVSAFLKKVMFEEIVPFVPLPEAERQSYAASIMERFSNPYIRHELISIALNSVSKWKVRVLPTVKDYAAGKGKAPAGLSFSLAALLWFYKGEMKGSDYIGTRNAGTYPIKDDAAVIKILSTAWNEAKPGQAAALATKLLADTRLWGEDLTKVPGLAEQASKALAAIEAKGITAALKDVIA
ncbi:tagaturonate reductase [Telmatospirillum sp.]|uniref:tagaturonate reductase n=1 Tax=Telmatospirillum sp. TaxID=2079197 RepID=UPI00283BB3AC|nr:tagaturonate reductase [Telmatospirillum sp.]MDR3435328.1 tagaturonate reductase [Telmatospirillum sp.]